MNKSQLFKKAHELAKTLFEGAYAARLSAALKMVYASLKNVACSAIKEVKKLNGTEKQVKWATSLKSKFLNILEQLDVNVLNDIFKSEFETYEKSYSFVLTHMQGHILELKNPKLESYKEFKKKLKAKDQELVRLFEEFRNELSLADLADQVEDAALFIENRDDEGIDTACALVIYSLAKKLGLSPRTNEKNYECFSYDICYYSTMTKGKYLNATEKSRKIKRELDKIIESYRYSEERDFTLTIKEEMLGVLRHTVNCTDTYGNLVRICICVDEEEVKNYFEGIKNYLNEQIKLLPEVC